MRTALRAACGLLLIISALTATPARAATEFFDEEIANGAVRYEALLASTVHPGRRTAAQWLAAASAALTAGDSRAASQAFAAAVVLSPDNAGAWLGLAATLAATAPRNNDERYELPEQASFAAYVAYRRSPTPQLKAQSLALLGELLTRRDLYRAALNAYRASLALVEGASVRAAYEALRKEHGFRILDYSVDADTPSPRMCIQFSESLRKGRVDFANFVRVNGSDPAAVTSEGRQLCVEGFKHGERYEVELRAGLPSALDETLPKTARYTVYVRDRQPSVRFVGNAYVLPRTGQQGLPVLSVNTDAVDVEIFRISDRSLAPTVIGGEMGEQLIYGYSLERLAQDRGRKVWSGQLAVTNRLNEEVTTALPVAEVLPDLMPGVYVAVASPSAQKPDEWEARASQWFVVSDLGLAAVSGDDGITGFVRSLATAAPLRDVEVRLVARDNEVLATEQSDARGVVRFAPGLARGTGGAAPALLVARSAQGDYGFLDLTAAGFDLSDRGVAGRAAPEALDAFLYTERGVYRPGSEVHVVALLRDRDAVAVTGMPLTLIFERPDGVEHRRVLLPDAGQGGRSFTLPLLATAMTGTWRVAAYADPKGPAVGETRFLVEDYVPDRMELELTPRADSVAAGDSIRLDAQGRYLYGAPASGLALEGEVGLVPRRTGLEGFPGFQFGLADEDLAPVRRPLLGLPVLDANGRAEVAAPLPELPDSTLPFTAEVTLRLREPAGRAVASRIELPVRIAQPLIGIRPLFKDGHASEGANAAFEILTVGADGQRTAFKGLRWQLFKVEKRFQWYRSDGYWTYEPVTYTRRIAEGELDTDASGPVRVEAPVDYGRYKLEVSVNASQALGPATSILFTAGWYGAEAADSPDFLDVSLDKASYRPGETARVTLTPRMPGKALVAILREGVLAMQAIDVGDGPTSVTFTVGDAWGPGVYVAAMLYRPMDVPAQRMPGRSVGVTWLGVDMSPRKLALGLDLPDKVAPRSELAVPIEVAGLAPGEEAFVTVAAVDVGILNLTSYEAPAPEDWYFAQRRLGVDIRDLYGRLIDGMRAERGRIRSGGDGGGGLGMHGSPPTQPPVALFSGIVRVDAAGKARVLFDVPNFNGTLRVMAVAWTRDKLGHAARDVIIRDPVVVTGTLPRFLAKGDTARLHLSIDNVEGPAGTYLLELAADGPVSISEPRRTLTLDSGARAEAGLPLAADGLGEAKVTARLAGPEGLMVEQSFAVAVRPAEPPVTRHSVQTIAARNGTLTLSRDLFADFIPGTETATLSVSAQGALDIPGLLLALDRYPYGCAEQTVSRALPLLYVNELADRMGLATDAAAGERVQKAIDAVLAMQSSSGGFGLWGPGDDIWLTAYVADFLSRARERTYAVPEQAYRLALDRLTNYVVNTSAVEDGGEALAYSLYVLARTGRANIGDLRYFADTKLDEFRTPLAKAQIGAALALYGDNARAERSFAAAFAQGEPVAPATRSDYGSELRDGAGLLTLAAETRTRLSAIPALAQQVAQSRFRRSTTSTQENAWMLLAAHALEAQARELTLLLDGKIQQGPVRKTLTAADLHRPIKLVNRGEAPATASVTVSGAPVTPEPASAHGFALERRYFTLDGTPVALERIAQNERLVVTLKVTEVEPMHTRLLLVDHLPAGFEIENPRLGGGGGEPQLPWFAPRGAPVHREYRDDRFVAAYDLDGTEPAVVQIAYVVRAVSPGTYALPPALAEDMYRPDRFARTDSGRIEITAAP